LARVAVLGGSFNPIHYGHLLLAEDVLDQLALDRVLFVPAGSPPHKPAALLAPAADRFEMVRRAIADHPRFDVSDVELRRTGPSFTVDTLTALAAGGDQLYYIVGSETFLDLLTWREPRKVAALARLVVIPRAGSVFDTQGAAAQKVLHEIGVEGGFVHAGGAPPPARGVLIVHATSLPLSASDLRRRVREGRSLVYRVPPAVIDYVQTHGLYRVEPA
jgi:nicotinate-nucleotide adenylyltransferase